MEILRNILFFTVIFATESGFFWIFLLSALLVLLLLSRRRKWPRWITALATVAMIVPATVATFLWEELALRSCSSVSQHPLHRRTAFIRLSAKALFSANLYAVLRSGFKKEGRVMQGHDPES